MMDEFNPYAAPSATHRELDALPEEMTWKDIWFSFDGRISRSTFWLKGFLPLYGIILLCAGLYGALSVMLEQALTGSASSLLSAVGVIAIMVGCVFFCWAGLAIYTKRWHDRGKSGWWALIGIIPYIGGLWIFIECGCLAGTPGPNQYGPDPLQSGRYR